MNTNKHDIYRTPKPCPFCGAQPELFPKNPKEEGNAWAEVACVNEQCRVRPKCRDGATISADGIDYFHFLLAILAWHNWGRTCYVDGSAPGSQGS